MQKVQSSTGEFERTNIYWSCCGIKGPRFPEFTCCYQSQRRHSNLPFTDSTVAL